MIHWSGGRHSELRVEKRATGRHGQSTDLEVVEVVRQMAGQYPDQQIAATLNRMGLQTGAGNTWTESRIRALRSHQKIPCHDAKECDDRILTIEQAAKLLNISASSVRQLILESKVLPAKQVIAYAPWQIERASLELATVKEAVARIKNRVRSPQCEDLDERPLLFSIT